MAYNALNNLIDAYIYANGVQAITGQILNGVLKQMVSQLGSGYHLMGVAGPETVPEQNDFAMAYFAATAGEYTDFGGITLAAGEVAVLLTSGNGSWEKQTIYTVPTTTEDLENTAGFITNAVTDLVNYYTKTEVDDTLANYPTLEALATALADYYTKQEVDTTLDDYATKDGVDETLEDYYTKDEVDAELADRYTKQETDTKLEDYYKKTETYDKDEVDSLIATLSRQEYIVAWDGLAAPDVSAIPAGVTVTYSGTTYTGTLAASASTVNKIYMVWNGVAYDMYGTSQDGGYSWVPMGTTSVDLSQYATKSEVSQLQQEVDDLEEIVDTIVVETPVDMQLVLGEYMKYSDETTLESSVAEYWQGILPAGTYKISGFSLNASYPCLAKKVGGSYSRTIYPGDAQIVTDYEINLDSDTEVIINGRSDIAPISATKTELVTLLDIYNDVEDTKEDVSEIKNIIGDVEAEKALSLQLVLGEYMKYSDLSTLENSSAEYWQGILPAGTYKISGFSVNSSYPCLAKKVNGSFTRVIYPGDAEVVTDYEITFSEATEVIINGRQDVGLIVVKTNQPVTFEDVYNEVSNVSKVVNDSIPLRVKVRKYTDAQSRTCLIYDVFKRLYGSYDVCYSFGNKYNTPNANFDFYGIALYNRGAELGGGTLVSEYFAAQTDSILPIIVAAVNNANGDFPTSTDLYTGGYHGYNNASTSTTKPTSETVSQKIYADGKEIADGGDVFCSKVEMVVKTNVQGCNTEKSDGSGREIMEQTIIVRIDALRTDVSVQWKALEDVIVYSLHGFAISAPSCNGRFLGSETDRGAYPIGTLKRTISTPDGIRAILSSGHYLDILLNRTLDLGRYGYNTGQDSYKATITTANKIYTLMLNEQTSLLQGELMEYSAEYRFV